MLTHKKKEKNHMKQNFGCLFSISNYGLLIASIVYIISFSMVLEEAHLLSSTDHHFGVALLQIELHVIGIMWLWHIQNVWLVVVVVPWVGDWVSYII